MRTPKDPLAHLQKHAIAALAAQTTMLRNVQRQMALEIKAGDLNAEQKADLKRLSDQASAVGRGAAALLAEARKQIEADIKAGENMSAEDRVTKTIEWLPDCPIEQRTRLADALHEIGIGL